MWFGGDYNPEQWPPAVWAEDFALMRQAGVNLVTVGVFAWSRLQPSAGAWEPEWLDTVMDGLHQNGIGVCLATPTASPPPWFTQLNPDSLPVTREGVRLTHGSRDTYCVNSALYRNASVRLAKSLCDRYGQHPALKMWHVHNEYGTWCFCSTCAVEFRTWLQRRYSAIAALNDAWSTDFWSQRYARWDDIMPPRATQYLRNPAQELDYRRFLSDSHLRHFRAQKAVLTSGQPVTTNFVLGGWVPVDHARWAREVDLVAIDHYPSPGPDETAQRAFAGDLARGWARGGRWLLMEHAPAAGRLLANAWPYIERGTVGVMYFQWRASRGGAEQWHPALLPHEGPQTPAFREVKAVGTSLRDREALTVRARAALLYDEETMWAWQSDHVPAALDYSAVVARWHAHMGTPTDVLPIDADLTGYDLVVVPALYLMSAAAHARLRAYAASGATLVVTAGSGLVDDCVRVTPNSLADLIGARTLGLGPDWRPSLELEDAVEVEEGVIRRGSVYYVTDPGRPWLPKPG